VAERVVQGDRIALRVYTTVVYRWPLKGSCKNCNLKRRKCIQASDVGSIPIVTPINRGKARSRDYRPGSARCAMCASRDTIREWSKSLPS
jgi:hypothetical protein